MIYEGITNDGKVIRGNDIEYASLWPLIVRKTESGYSKTLVRPETIKEIEGDLDDES